MKFRWLTGFLVLVPLLSVRSEPEAASPAPTSLLGYSAQNALQQGQWEKKFRAGISASNIRENMRRLSARPHHVGSPYDKDNAQWILSKFKEWGFDAKIETFNVLFPTPKIRVLEMLQPSGLSSQIDRTGSACRSNLDPSRRAAAHLQRIFRRWRRYRAADLRQLRQSRGLREAGPSGYFGQGRDRDCALWPGMARHQTQGGGRARRHRLHHLLRSQGGRLFRRR